MKVYYFPSGGRLTPSSRARIYNLEDWLKSRGVQIGIHEEKPPFHPLDADILVYQKVTKPYGIAEKAKKKGIPIIFDCSDVKEGKIKKIATIANIVTTSSIPLIENVRSRADIKDGIVIEDPVDYIKGPLPPRIHTKKDDFIIIFTCSRGEFNTINPAITPLIKLRETVNFEFRYICGENSKWINKRRGGTIKRVNKLGGKHVCWNIDTFSNEYRNADIAIAPQTRMHKTATKVTLAVAHNLPVVSSWTPSHLKFARGTGTEEFCVRNDNSKQWYKMLKRLCNPDERNKFLKKTLPYLWRVHSVEGVGREWLKLFNSLVPEKKRVNLEKRKKRIKKKDKHLHKVKKKKKKVKKK